MKILIPAIVIYSLAVFGVSLWLGLNVGLWAQLAFLPIAFLGGMLVGYVVASRTFS